MSLMRIIFLVFVCVFCTNALDAQRGWEVGAMTGVMQYFGDLNTSHRLDGLHPFGGVIVRKNFDERFSLKSSFNYGRISGDDANSQNTYERTRNLSFRSNIAALNLQAEINFFPYVHGSRMYNFSPYMFIGLAGIYYNPEANYQGEWYKLRELGTEGQNPGDEYFFLTHAFNIGGGIKFDITSKWSVNIELNIQKTATDYLDDVSTEYVNKSGLESLRGPVAVALHDRSIEIPGGPTNIGAPGRQRGNPNDKDHYVRLGAGLVYFISNLKCPRISTPEF